MSLSPPTASSEPPPADSAEETAGDAPHLLLDDLLPPCPPSASHPPGAPEMLRLVAYDIACPRRLRRVAMACEDYGLRVQKSLFECWLEQDRFDRLWDRLSALIHPEEDSLAAYVIDAGDASRRRAAGTFVPTRRRESFIF